MLGMAHASTEEDLASYFKRLNFDLNLSPPPHKLSPVLKPVASSKPHKASLAVSSEPSNACAAAAPVAPQGVVKFRFYSPKRLSPKATSFAPSAPNQGAPISANPVQDTSSVNPPRDDTPVDLRYDPRYEGLDEQAKILLAILKSPSITTKPFNVVHNGAPSRPASTFRRDSASPQCSACPYDSATCPCPLEYAPHVDIEEVAVGTDLTWSRYIAPEFEAPGSSDTLGSESKSPSYNLPVSALPQTLRSSSIGATMAPRLGDLSGLANSRFAPKQPSSLYNPLRLKTADSFPQTPLENDEDARLHIAAQAENARLEREREERERERLAKSKEDEEEVLRIAQLEQEERERQHLAKIRAEKEEAERCEREEKARRAAQLKKEQEERERQRLVKIQAEKEEAERREREEKARRAAQLKKEQEERERQRLAKIKAEQKKAERKHRERQLLLQAQRADAIAQIKVYAIDSGKKYDILVKQTDVKIGQQATELNNFKSSINAKEAEYARIDKQLKFVGAELSSMASTKVGMDKDLRQLEESKSELLSESKKLQQEAADKVVILKNEFLSSENVATVLEFIKPHIEIHVPEIELSKLSLSDKTEDSDDDGEPSSDEDSFLDFGVTPIPAYWKLDDTGIEADRVVRLVNLPTDIAEVGIQALVWGGRLDRIVYTPEDNTAEVHFLIGQECAKYYEATANHIPYPGDKNRLVRVEKCAPSPRHPFLRYAWENEVTRCIMVTGIPSGWTKGELKKFAASHGREVEQVLFGKTAKGVRLAEFRFLNIAHANAFKFLLKRDIDFYQVKSKYADDQCAINNGVHTNPR